MKVLDGEDLEGNVRRRKTDQEGKGSVFHMSGERMNSFSIPDVLV